MSKIIVTGASGMLGTELCKLISLNNDLLGIASKPKLLLSSDTQVVAADITQLEIIKRSICDFSPDIIIHAAAYKDVDGCELDPEKAYLINGIGTKNIASVCSKCGAKLIYISTDYVFDGEKSTPYEESDIPNPINVYGKSKLEGERYVSELLDKWYIIRTSSLFGEYGKNFIDTILEKARRQDELRVVKDCVGSPTYCVDLADAINRLINLNEYGVYHITNNGYCSRYEFACEILKLASFDSGKVTPIDSSDIKQAAPRPRNVTLANSRLQSITGYVMAKWQDALRRYLESVSHI